VKYVTWLSTLQDGHMCLVRAAPAAFSAVFAFFSAIFVASAL
jgi:hypothetical protein